MIAFTEKGRYENFNKKLKRLSDNFTTTTQTVSIEGLSCIVVYGDRSNFIISGIAKIVNSEGITFKAHILKKICSKTSTKRKVRRSFLNQAEQFFKANS